MRHGSGCEVPSDGSVRPRPRSLLRDAENRERWRRFVRDGRRGGGVRRGRAGAVDRRGEDEAGAGRVGQGRGVHGHQGNDDAVLTAEDLKC